jgi:hypothetical protein
MHKNVVQLTHCGKRRWRRRRDEIRDAALGFWGRRGKRLLLSACGRRRLRGLHLGLGAGQGHVVLQALSCHSDTHWDGYMDRAQHCHLATTRNSEGGRVGSHTMLTFLSADQSQVPTRLYGDSRNLNSFTASLQLQ